MKKDALNIETKDGEFLFTLGYTHENNTSNCYLQYTEFIEGDDPRFKRTINGKDYLKITSIIHYFSPEEYFQRAARSKAIKYLEEDSLLGKIFKVREEDIKQATNPKEALNKADRKTKNLIEEMARIMKIKKEDTGITGSLAYGKPTGQTDLDIVIYGKDNCIKATRTIKELIKDREHQVIKYNRIHHRIFHIGGRIIDPHFVLNEDENTIMEDYNFVFRGTKTLKDVIEENEESCFTPAIYKTRKGYFVTYTIGHRLLLNKGTKIEVPTKFFEGTHKKNGTKNSFYIWRMEDGWLDPTKGGLFSQRMYDIPKAMKNAA